MLPIIIIPFPTETAVQSQNFHAKLEVKAQRTQTNKPDVVHFVHQNHNHCNPTT